MHNNITIAIFHHYDKIPKEITQGVQSLFCLTVSEGKVNASLAPRTWNGHGSRILTWKSILTCLCTECTERAHRRKPGQKITPKACFQGPSPKLLSLPLLNEVLIVKTQ